MVLPQLVGPVVRVKVVVFRKVLYVLVCPRKMENPKKKIQCRL